MSVICYDHTEILAAFAATWNRGSAGSTDALRHLEYLAEAAARIQEANLAAYNATYPREAATGLSSLESLTAARITASDIKGALIRQTVDDRNRGMRTLRGLRYNLIANNGQDFATAEILDDLLSMFTAAFDRAERRAA